MDGVTPTGLVRERAWTRLADTMYDAIGWRPPEEATPALIEGFTSFLSSKGVVALLDAATTRDAIASAATLDAEESSTCTTTARRSSRAWPTWTNASPTFARGRRSSAVRTSRCDTLKLFLDATNEFGTGAVLEPIVSGDGGEGVLRMTEDDLTTVMLRLDAERIDLHIHVVGDRGFRTALNAVKRARKDRGGAWQLQVTLAHDELIDPTDMPRVAELGVILNWSPHWSGGMFGVATAEHLGWERFNRMYQFNPVIDERRDRHLRQRCGHAVRSQPCGSVLRDAGR